MNFPINLAFLVISFAYSIILLFFFFGKRRIKTNENRIFGVLLILNICSIIMEALCVMTGLLIEEVNLVTLIINRAFLIIFTLNMSFIALYVTNLVELSDGISISTKKKLQKYLKIIIFLIAFVSCVLVCFLDIEFYKQDGRMYSYGPAVNLLFGIIFFTLTLCIVYLLVTSRSSAANRKRNIPVFVFLLGFLICMVIQKKYPHITLANSVFTIINLLIYHSIENPMFNELAMAKNVATEANSAKKDFLSSMSHEIRTPLNAIVGLSQLIREEKDSGELIKDTDEIFIASHNLLDIINSILDANSISTNEIEIDNTDYDLRKELDNLTHIIDVMLINKNIEFNTNYSNDLPVILNGDISKLKRVLNNILTNAVKYTNEGSITFTVNSVNKGNNCSLIFEIKDTGRGMSEEQKAKLFEQFYRREEDKDSNISGVGLGLSITKYFVDIMNGSIDVETELNVGTTIKIEIPQRIIKLNNEENIETL